MRDSLKTIIAHSGLSHSDAARAMGLSKGRMSLLLAGKWQPVRRRSVMALGLSGAMLSAGASASTAQAAHDLVLQLPQQSAAAQKEGAQKNGALTAKAAAPHSPPSNHQVNKESTAMLNRKTTLVEAARKQFGIARDPFTADLNETGDVYLNPDIRYVRESLWQTVKHGGLLAVVGESGAGKTTLKRELIERISREHKPFIVIEPYVLAMEDSDTKGKTLKSAGIAEAIVRTIAPLERIKRSADARFAQMHRLLKDSYQSGNKHVLLIEEAHCLPTATLKHLKRFYELQIGFSQLLAIVLIGQPELRLKLSEKNAEVREVVQRCEVVELPPLDAYLADYLKFKFKRVGADAHKLFDAGAIEAVRAKLTFATRDKQALSLLYPLAVANVAAACLNLAASLGAPCVTADIVQEA